MRHSTLGVTVVVADGARATVNPIGGDAVAVDLTGHIGEPTLHWASLDELEDWYHDLGSAIVGERLRRLEGRAALDEMDAILRKAGAR